MTIKRALISIESMNTEAFFETEVVLQSGEQVGPALLLEVTDFDEALEIVETISRSKAQRKRERKPPEPEKPEESAPATKPLVSATTGPSRA